MFGSAWYSNHLVSVLQESWNKRYRMGVCSLHIGVVLSECWTKQKKSPEPLSLQRWYSAVLTWSQEHLPFSLEGTVKQGA